MTINSYTLHQEDSNWPFSVQFPFLSEDTNFHDAVLKQLTFAEGCFTMKGKSIVITGGTGLIGQEAQHHFLAQGYSLRILSRSSDHTDSANVRYFKWNPSRDELPIEALQGVEAIVHLAGAPIAERWTDIHKSKIISSRVETAALLLKTLLKLPESDRPSTIIGASAVGWYPSSNTVQSENEPRAEGFIGDVTEAWENSLHGFRNIGIRTVSLRIGLVLSKNGGFLGRLKPIFGLGLGSAIGSGEHWQSWIHINDVVRMLDWTIQNSSCNGVYNATAPETVTSIELTRTLARAMKRPFWAPNVPEFALRLVFGEMSGILLASHRMDPSKILSTGYSFEYPELQDALQAVLT
jgi:uncharacterized protein (TIGR01777 family)